MKKIKRPTVPSIMVSATFCFNEKKELLLVLHKDRDYRTPPTVELKEIKHRSRLQQERQKRNKRENRSYR